MNKTLKNILSISFKSVDYSSVEKQKELKNLLNKEKEIDKRTKVNWEKLNKLIINI